MKEWTDVTPQNKEGKQRLGTIYQVAVEAYSQCPTFSKYVATEEWLAKEHQNSLSHEGRLVAVTFPFFYYLPMLVRAGFFAESIFLKMDQVLHLVKEKAIRRNWTDLVGNMKKSNGFAAAFELLLGVGLVDQFGEDAIEPYPKIGDGSKTMDWCIKASDHQKLLIEAVTIYDDKQSTENDKYLLDRGIMSSSGVVDTEKHATRVANAIISKALQRQPESPFVLCMGQYSHLPFPEQVESDVTTIVNENLHGAPNLVGYFYFTNDCLILSHLRDLQAKKLEVAKGYLAKAHEAFLSLRGQ